MLDFQPWTIFFTIVNLLILYFFFRKFLFGRVNAVLEQREALIRTRCRRPSRTMPRPRPPGRNTKPSWRAPGRKPPTWWPTPSAGRCGLRYRLAQAEADAKQTAAEAEARIAAERSEMLRMAGARWPSWRCWPPPRWPASGWIPTPTVPWRGISGKGG